MNMRKIFMLLGLSAVLLGGCANNHSCPDPSEVRLFRTPTEFSVNAGLKSYYDGDYAASINTLQSVVDDRAATKSEKLIAYKFLAFSHCITPSESREQRERMCRDSFRRAFLLNPEFKLSSAEAGHPIWGPIFSSVKSKISK